MIIKVLLPLNSGAGLGSEVIEDTVHAVDLGGDAVCDMLEKLEGNILDGAVIASRVLTARMMTG